MWHKTVVWWLKYWSFTWYLRYFNPCIDCIVAFRVAGDKEMAGSRYDSDFLSVHHGGIHLTSIIRASTAPDTQTTEAELRIINPLSVPLVFCPPWCHILFLSLSLYILYAKHTERAKGKKERRDMHVGSGICRESAAPAKTQWQAGWRQRGGHPTPHRSSVCLARLEPERSETLPHYTINAHQAAVERQSPPARWIRHVSLSLWYTMQLTLAYEDGQKSSTCTQNYTFICLS